MAQKSSLHAHSCIGVTLAALCLLLTAALSAAPREPKSLFPDTRFWKPIRPSKGTFLLLNFDTEEDALAEDLDEVELDEPAEGEGEGEGEGAGGEGEGGGGGEGGGYRTFRFHETPPLTSRRR